MKVTAHDDFLLLQRYTPKKKGEFIDNTGSTYSPFFIVVSADASSSSFNEGELVIPRADRLVQCEIDGEQYYWCQDGDIMGTGDESE